MGRCRHPDAALGGIRGFRMSLFPSTLSVRAAGLALTVGVVLFLSSATQALAQTIPEYDTEAFCERRSGPNMPENRRFASCLWIEEIGLGEAEDHWSEASETARFECVEEANETESYVALASCVMHRVRQQRRSRQ
jgi:hypothetical protein